MSSEEPVRSVPDELFQQVTAKAGRQLPDALFGPPPARPARQEREEPIRSVPDELFKQVTARSERSLPDALFGPPPVPAPVAAEPESAEAAGESASAEDDVASVGESLGESGGSSTASASAETAAAQPETGAVAAEAVVTDAKSAAEAGATTGSDSGAPEDSDSSLGQAQASAPVTGAEPDPAGEVESSDTVGLPGDAVGAQAPAGAVSEADRQAAGTAQGDPEAPAPGDSQASTAARTEADSGAAQERRSADEGAASADSSVGPADSSAPVASDSLVAAPAAAESSSVGSATGPAASAIAETVSAGSVTSSAASAVAETASVGSAVTALAEVELVVEDAVLVAAETEPRAVESASPRPVLLVIADSLAYYGPKGGLPADDPRIWPNMVAAELDWDVELIARIGWTCRDAYWALIGDPRVWAAVPRAGAVVFAVGGMDTLPSPLPTALRELIRYIRPPKLRRGVRSTYNWLQPKLSKLGRPVALPPKVSVDYLEQSREALQHLRPELPVVAVLPSVHKCDAYGRVHRGRARAVKALQAWSGRTSVPLVDLGEAVRDDIESGAANPDGIHWGWAGHAAVATAMTKALQEVR